MVSGELFQFQSFKFLYFHAVHVPPGLDRPQSVANCNQQQGSSGAVELDNVSIFIMTESPTEPILTSKHDSGLH